MRSMFGSSSTEPDSTQNQLLSLPGGRLDFLRLAQNHKPTRQCIYLIADLSIRTTSLPFHFQLIVNRVLLEDDELPDDEHDIEKSFLIDQAIGFTSYPSVDQGAGSTTFSWLDDSSSNRYEFIIDTSYPPCSPDKVHDFEEIIYRCMWERTHLEDSAEAPQEELDALRLIDHPASEPPLFRDRDSDSQSEPGTLKGTHSELEESDRAESESEEEEEDVSDDESTDDQLVDQLRGTRLNDPPATPASATRESPSLPGSASKPSVTPSSHKPRPSDRVRAGESPSARQTPSSAGKGKARASISPPASPDPTPTQTHEPLSTNSQAPEEPIIHSDSGSQSTHNDMICSWVEICDLYLFDRSADFQFVCKDRGVVASLWTPGPETTNQKACWLTVLESDESSSSDDERITWVSMNLGTEQVVQFSGGAFTFNYTYEPSDGSSEPLTYTWCCRFPDDEVSKDRYENAKEVFGKAFYDRDNGIGSWDQLEADTKYWNRQAAGVIVGQDDDVEMAYDGEEEEEEEEEVVDQEEDHDGETDEEDSEEEEEDSEAQKFRASKKSNKYGSNNAPKNSRLAVGYKEDMSFVLRGNIVGVFRNEVGGNKKLPFLGSTSVLTTPDGSRMLEPTDMMLHQQDSMLVFRDAKNPNSLYNLDLPTGKVVDEWKIDKSNAITNIIPRTKYSQMDPEATFVGTSHNSFYTIDPRLSGFKKVANQNMSYKSKTDFSCAVTTDTGDLAIGSNTGDIRLYSSNLGIRAKTVLGNVRDPNRGLDVSKDKRYLIATCPTYLVFFKVELDGKDGKPSGLTGFQKSFPVEKKPPGFRVELNPEHRAYIIGQGVPISFTRAKFNHGPDSLEKTVVTSIGPFIIAFNLRKLKLGQVEYTLKRYGEDVVAGGFKWSSDKEIVVTMASDVFIENRKKLAKPDRNSLVGKSSIVSNNRNSNTRASGSRLDGIVEEWQ